jgi:hypothetical protein
MSDVGRSGHFRIVCQSGRAGRARRQPLPARDLLAGVPGDWDGEFLQRSDRWELVGRAASALECTPDYYAEVVESPGPDAERRDDRLGGRISLQTLIIASLASAAASFAASRIWGPGTLISAAATPVVVALVSEFLRRPVQTVSTTAKRFPAAQSLPAVRKRTIAAPEDPTLAKRGPADHF